MTVGRIVGDPDTGAWVAGMDDTVVSHVDCNVTAVADNVAGSGIFNSAVYCPAHGTKGRGGMGQRPAEMSVDGHYETGTVGSVCEAGSAVHIRVTQETSCVSYDGFPFGAVGGSCSVLGLNMFSLHVTDHIPNLHFNPFGIGGEYLYLGSFFQGLYGFGVAFFGRVNL